MLVSTRTAAEVTEPVVGAKVVVRPSLASQASFFGAGTASTRVDDPRFRGGSGGLRIKKVIGGVEADERFGFVTPDAVSPDHNRYAAEYRDMLRTALGGVDELSISAGATAFEIKSLYGRAQR